MKTAELRALLDRHGLHLSRDLGQNFLTDADLADELARKAGAEAGDFVIEVGTGLGVLTRAIAARAARVRTVEVDAGLVRALQAEDLLPANVELVHADARELDFAAWAREAARRGLNPNMLIEFVDGSKTMIEMAAVSNATGLVPDVRGMHGPTTSRDKLKETFALKEHGGVLNRAGVVDYGIGGVHPGVFLVVTTDHPRLRQALVYRDMGDGPYYTLFRPFHLCSIEVPLTCAMLAIRKKSNMTPLNRLVSEVFAVAKQDLSPGHTLEGIGGCDFYGLIDNYEIAQGEKLVPVGLAKGAEVAKPVERDAPITYGDVRHNENSTVFRLRQLQDIWMAGRISEQELLESVDRIAQE